MSRGASATRSRRGGGCGVALGRVEAVTAAAAHAELRAPSWPCSQQSTTPAAAATNARGPGRPHGQPRGHQGDRGAMRGGGAGSKGREGGPGSAGRRRTSPRCPTTTPRSRPACSGNCGCRLFNPPPPHARTQAHPPGPHAAIPELSAPAALSSRPPPPPLFPLLLPVTSIQRRSGGFGGVSGCGRRIAARLDGCAESS